MCQYDKNCRRHNCWFRHSTQNRKSPAHQSNLSRESSPEPPRNQPFNMQRVQMILQCQDTHKEYFKNFAGKIINQYQNFQINLNTETTNTIIASVLNAPDFEVIMEKLEGCIPLSDSFNFQTDEDDDRPINVDLVKKIFNDLRSKKLSNYKFQPFLTVEKLPDWSNKVRVFVMGPKSEESAISSITDKLRNLIKEEYYKEMPPVGISKMKHECLEHQKQKFEIESFLTNLQPKSRGVIKSFDLSKVDEVEVSYKQIEQRDFSWLDIKIQVEEQLDQYVKFYPKQSKRESEGDDQQTNDDMNKLLAEFLQANPSLKDQNLFKNIEIDVIEEDKINKIAQCIEISGQWKDQLKLEKIRDDIKNYYNTSFKRTFRLFPLFLNQNEQTLGIFNQFQEEEKGQENFQLSIPNRFYIFNYLKNNSDNHQLIITDAGVHRQQANLTFLEENLSIKVETFKNLYNVIRQNLINIIKTIKIQELDTLSYISLYSDYTYPIKGNDIRKQLQEDYNISITYPVFRNHSIHFQEGSGGFKVEPSKSFPGQFYVKKYDQRIINKDYEQGRMPVKKKQIYVMTGISKDVLHSQLPIMNELQSKYQCKIEPFPLISEGLFNEFPQRRQEISIQTEVYIRSERQLIAYIGEEANIIEAKQQIQEVIEQKKTIKNLINISPDFLNLIKISISQLKNIAISKNCNINIIDEQVQLSGNQHNINTCEIDIRNKIQEIQDSIFSVMITNLQMYEALRDLKNNPYFNEQYHVHVKKVGDIYSQSVPSSPKKIKPEIQVKTQTQTIDAPQWGFKINYNQKDLHLWYDREDKQENFRYYDSDQSWQIEKHYQDCLSGSKLFNSECIITGDINHIAIGFEYKVWGASSDPSTWRQQNISVKHGQIRQLKRYIVKKESKSIIEEQKKSKELDQRAQKLMESPSIKRENQIIKGIYKENNDCSGFLVLGMQAHVQKLYDEIQNIATDPKRHFSELPLLGLKILPNILQEMNNHFKKQYSSNQDLLGFIIKDDKIKIAGFKHKEILLKVTDFVDRLKSYRFPDNWTDVIDLISSTEYCIVKDVIKDSQDWNKVDLRFKMTMPEFKIEKIQRIQNRRLWRAFSNESEEVKQNNNGNENLDFLFHGTRGTPPAMIYLSQEGFDVIYSSEGLWGRANYFAKNSSYSHNYSYSLPTGEKQMFMAQVIIGNSVVINRDRTLIKPPNQPGTTIPYDSVRGNTKDCDVVMVYSNKKAYPTYLITYK